MGANEQLLSQLKKLSGSAALILGIGNTLKGDDGLGPLLCRELKDKPISAELIDAGSVPENYIQPIIKKAPKNLLIVDAVDFSAPPGTIKLIEPEQLSSIAISTHVLSPALFIDMVRRQIDVDVYFIGVQPAQTNLGQAVSPPVAAAVRQLIDILTEVFPEKHQTG